MSSEQAKPPRGLGIHGRKVWRDVAADMADRDLKLTPIERIWLGSAARMTDQAAILEDELSGAPRIVRGSMGQDVSNPLVSELRQLHLAINLTLSRIETEVAEASGIVPVGNQQRQAINTRWRGRGA